MLKIYKKQASAALVVLKTSGVLGLTRAIFRKLGSGGDESAGTWHNLVRANDATKLQVNQVQSRNFRSRNLKGKETYNLAWIMSPPGETSGGHQNLFRFIEIAEKAGHTCSIFFYSSNESRLHIPSIAKMLAKSDSFPTLKATLHAYRDENSIDNAVDAIFATGWETAYPAALSNSDARRLYLVQDFEPWFYPVGSESVLATQTYNFNFTGITAGKWLSTKLASEFGMETYHFDFGVDTELYYRTRSNRRDGVFFYARPVTPRRGFELGLLVLAEFSKRNPDVTIHLAGWDFNSKDLAFNHVNHGALGLGELNELYNQCSAGLVLSLTNFSLLPLELLSAGVRPVINSAPNNRLVEENPFMFYSDSDVPSLTVALEQAFIAGNNATENPQIDKYLSTKTWHQSGVQFLEALKRAINA